MQESYERGRAEERAKNVALLRSQADANAAKAFTLFDHGLLEGMRYAARMIEAGDFRE